VLGTLPFTTWDNTLRGHRSKTVLTLGAFSLKTIFSCSCHLGPLDAAALCYDQLMGARMEDHAALRHVREL